MPLDLAVIRLRETDGNGLWGLTLEGKPVKGILCGEGEQEGERARLAHYLTCRTPDRLRAVVRGMGAPKGAARKDLSRPHTHPHAPRENPKCRNCGEEITFREVAGKWRPCDPGEVQFMPIRRGIAGEGGAALFVGAQSLRAELGREINEGGVIGSRLHFCKRSET